MDHLQHNPHNLPLQLTSRPYNDDNSYDQQDQDRRMPSTFDSVVHDDEASSSFYDDWHNYPEEQSSHRHREEQNHRDDDQYYDNYYDEDDDNNGRYDDYPVDDNDSGSLQLHVYPEEESYRHREEQSHRDNDYGDDGHYDRNHGHERSDRDFYESDKHHEDNNHPDDPPPSRSRSRSRSRSGSSRRHVKNHQISQEPEDDHPPPSPSPSNSFRSREPPSVEPPPSHNSGRHSNRSQDPPSSQSSILSHKSKPQKKKKQQQQQRDPPSAASVIAENNNILVTTKIGDDPPIAIKDSGNAAISTMSASAITFVTHASKTSSMWSSVDGGTKSRGGKSTYKYPKSYGIPQIVIPNQINFPKKGMVPIGSSSGLPKDDKIMQIEESSVLEISYNDVAKDKPHNKKNHRENKNWGADTSRSSAQSVVSSKHRKGWGADATSSRYDDRSVALSSKPRPPLRRPDAPKSRDTMKGRGKSTRSVGGDKSAVGDKSISKEPKRKPGRSRHGGEGSRSRSRDAYADGRQMSQSRDMKRGRDRRGVTRNGDSADRGSDRNGGSDRRGLSRGRATRNVSRDYDDRRSYDDHRSYDSGRRSRSSSGLRRHHSDDSYVNSTSDRSRSSRGSVRHDMDDEGYCMHHPEIRLMSQRSDGSWRVIRKKCPECIMEDCPRMMDRRRDDRSPDRSLYDYDDRSRRSSRSPGRSAGGDSTYMSHSINSRRNDDSFSSGGESLGAFHDLSMAFQTPEEMEEEEATNRLKRRLAARAYHFPGNTWCQDWMQYLSNTHTVLGLFFHHPLHPMRFQERLVILIGSIAIGLTISNLTYLYFIRNGFAVEEEVFTLNSHHTEYTGIPVVSITTLMITLWTLGSFLHTCFDLGLWHMKACTICRYQGRIDERTVQWGRVAGLFIVMISIFSGGYAVLLRAGIEYKGEGSVAEEVQESIMGNEVYHVKFEDPRSFKFLLGYLVEFVLALFVYYPLAVTILFSGVLGFGRFPLLGGRPREMKRESQYELSKREPKILKAANIESEEHINGIVGDDGSMDDYKTMSYRDDESRSRFDDSHII
mmetsp:Transcript_18980/g.41361  ORF Transcript_18980/g.41361 Transcript_18980/m.41361 type:complete len:1052 (+) Transcript_18980:88-3243(+)